MARSSQNYWSLGLLVLSGVLFFVAENDGTIGPDAGHSEQSSLNPSSDMDQRLNSHLHETSDRLQMSDELRKLRNFKAPTVGETVFPQNHLVPEAPNKGLGISEESTEETLYKKLHEHDRKANSTLTPSDIVEQQVQQNRMDQREVLRLEQSRREWVRQYIENARKMGYIVTINKDYIVEHVERLPGFSQPQSRVPQEDQ